MGNYTVYVNPYLVLKSGGYTKHFYIEGQRIVSKLGGGWNNTGSATQAGATQVDYSAKGKRLLDGIVKNLKFLGADGSVLTAGKSGKVPPGQVNGTGNVTEAFRYFYHPDHLGSTSYVTDASGEVYQHLEYFAFGETFVEEHSNTSRIPYLFNGKELDEETGLYYYRARYYDARTSVWQSVDAMAEKYPALSPYVYTGNNPLNAVDPNGNDIIFINGYIGFGSPPAGKEYWSSNFVTGAKNYFNDRSAKFTNYEPSKFSTASERKAAGIAYAKSNLEDLTKGMSKDKDSFKLVTHSMGAAFGEGIAEYLKGEGWKIDAIVHVEPFQAADITTLDPNSNQTQTIDYQNPDDWVINNTPTATPGDIKGADSKVREKSGDGNWQTRHTSPIWQQGKKFWDTLKEKIIKSCPHDEIKIPAKNEG